MAKKNLRDLWGRTTTQKFAEEFIPYLHQQFGIGEEESPYTLDVRTTKDFLRLRLGRQGYEDPLVIDVAPGPMTPWGRSVAMPSISTGGKYSRLFGPEVWIEDEDERYWYARSPYEAITNYMKEVWEAHGSSTAGKWSKIISKGSGTSVGSLQQYGPVHSAIAQWEMATRVSVGFGAGVRDKPAIWRQLHQLSSGEHPFFSHLRGYAPWSGDDNVTRFRNLKATGQVWDAGDFDWQVYAFGDTAEKALKHASVSFMGGVRETVDLMRPSASGGLEIAKPDFITRQEDSVGYRMMNMVLTGGGLTPMVVRPGTAITQATPIPGALISSRDVLQEQGIYGAFRQGHDPVPIITPHMRNLAQAKWQFGIMKEVTGEGGALRYEPTGEGLEGYVIPANETRVIGTYTYTRNDKEITQPFRVTAEGREVVLSKPELLLPMGFYETNLEGEGHPGVFSKEEQAAIGAGQLSYVDLASPTNPRYDARLFGAIVKAFQAGGGGAVSAVSRSEPYLNVLRATRVNPAAKSMAVKAGTVPMMGVAGEETLTSVPVTGGASRVINAILGELKNPLPQFMGHMMSQPGSVIAQSLTELFPEVPAMGRYARMRALQQEQMETSVRRGLISKDVALKTWPAISQDILAEAYAQAHGGESAPWLMSEEWRQRFLSAAMVSPERYLKQYNFGVQREAQWLKIGPVTTGEQEFYSNQMMMALQKQGMTEAQAQQEFKNRYEFRDIAGSDRSMFWMRQPFIYQTMATPVVPEDLAKGVRLGYQEMAAINLSYGMESVEGGGDGIAKWLGLSFDQPPEATGFMPPHAVAWRAMGKFYAYQFSQTNEPMPPSPEAAYRMSEEQMALLEAKVEPGMSLDEYEAIINEVAPESEPYDLLYYSATKQMIPRPRILKAISEFEGADEDMRPINRWAKRFPELMWEWAGGGTYEQGQMSKFAGDLSMIAKSSKSKTLSKTLSGRWLRQALGGRFSSATGMGLHVGVVSQERMDALLTETIRQAGYSPESMIRVGPKKRDVRRAIDLMREQVEATGGMPAIWGGEPTYGREYAVQAVNLVTPNILKQSGLSMQEASRVAGGIVMQGGVETGGIMALLGPEMERMGKDVDLDYAYMVSLGLFRGTGSYAKRGLQLPSKAAMGKYSRAVNESPEEFNRISLEALKAQSGLASGYLGSAEDIALAEGTFGHWVTKPGIRQMSTSDIFGAGVGWVEGKSGMGTAFNFRSWIEASMGALGFPGEEVGRAHTVGTKSYATFLEQTMKEVARHTETFMNSIIATTSSTGEGAMIMAKPRSTVGHKKLPLSFDDRMAWQLRETVLKDAMVEPEYAIDLFSRPGEAEANVARLAGGESAADILQGMISAPGFDITQTPIGLVAGTQLATRLTGQFSGMPYRIKSGPYEGHNALDVYGGEDIVWRGKTMSVREFTHQQEIEDTATLFQALSGRGGILKGNQLADIQNLMINPKSFISPEVQYLSLQMEAAQAHQSMAQSGVMSISQADYNMLDIGAIFGTANWQYLPEDLRDRVINFVKKTEADKLPSGYRKIKLDLERLESEGTVPPGGTGGGGTGGTGGGGIGGGGFGFPGFDDDAGKAWWDKYWAGMTRAVRTGLTDEEGNIPMSLRHIYSGGRGRSDVMEKALWAEGVAAATRMTGRLEGARFETSSGYTYDARMRGSKWKAPGGGLVSEQTVRESIVTDYDKALSEARASREEAIAAYAEAPSRAAAGRIGGYSSQINRLEALREEAVSKDIRGAISPGIATPSEKLMRTFSQEVGAALGEDAKTIESQLLAVGATGVGTLVGRFAQLFPKEFEAFYRANKQLILGGKQGLASINLANQLLEFSPNVKGFAQDEPEAAKLIQQVASGVGPLASSLEISRAVQAQAGAMGLTRAAKMVLPMSDKEVESVTKNLQDFREALADATKQIGENTVVRKKEVEAYARMEEARYQVRAARRRPYLEEAQEWFDEFRTGVRTATPEEFAARSEQLESLQDAERVDLERIRAVRERMAPAGVQIGRLTRRALGGWGLMYMRALANLPMAQAGYGYEASEQYLQQQYATAARYGGMQAVYQSPEAAVRWSQVVHGGTPMAMMREMGAGIPAGLRDIGAGAMAGIAGFAGLEFLAGAAGVESGLGIALTGIAPWAIPAGMLAFGAVSGISYATHPERSVPTYAVGLGQMESSNVFTRMGGRITSRWVGMWGGEATREAGRNIQALAAQAMQGQPLQYGAPIQLLPSEVPGGDITLGAPNMGATRPLTQEEQISFATYVASQDQFRGIQQEAAATIMRWGVEGMNVSYTLSDVENVARANYLGVDLPGMAAQAMSALRLPQNQYQATRAEIAFQDIRAPWQQSRIQAGLGVAEQLPYGFTQAMFGRYRNADARVQAETLALYARGPNAGIFEQEISMYEMAKQMGEVYAPNLPGPTVAVTPQERQRREQYYQRYSLRYQGWQSDQTAQLYGVAPGTIRDMFASGDMGQIALAQGFISQLPEMAVLGMNTDFFRGQSLQSIGQQMAVSRMMNVNRQAQAATGRNIAPMIQQAVQKLGWQRGTEVWEQAMAGNPYLMTQIAQGGGFTGMTFQGMDMGYMMAQSDINLQGQLTGLSPLTTSLQIGFQAPAITAANAWTGGDIGALTASYASMPWRQAAVEGLGKTYQGMAVPQYMQGQGGMRALQWAARQISYESQMASAGAQLAQLALQAEYQPQFWAIEDKQRALSRRQSEWGFQMQEEQFAMQGRQFSESLALQRRQQLMQRQWTVADWAVQDQTRAMQWGWRVEDFQENIRFTTGRERRLAERQMERETIMHDIEGEQIDTQRARQKEIWGLEDERHQMTIGHFNEQRKLQEENMKKQKEFYEEGIKLQDQMTKLQREYWQKQHDLQVAAAGAAAGYAAKMKQVQDDMDALMQQEEDRQGQLKLAQSYAGDMTNAIIDGLNYIIREAPGALKSIVKALGGGSGSEIPGYVPPTGPPGCFIDGTMVDTPYGPKPIEEIETGNLVMAYDGKIGQVVIGEVERTYSKNTVTTVMVITDKGTVQCTPGHRFYDGRGWVPAKRLKNGDGIKMIDGGFATVVTTTAVHEQHAVHNFTVAVYHNYYVHGHLVHNKKTQEGGDILPGQDVIVGERGPELLRLSTIGSVVNQYDLLAAQGMNDRWQNQSLISTGGNGPNEPKVVNVYIGNQHLARFVLDTVKKDLEV